MSKKNETNIKTLTQSKGRQLKKIRTVGDITEYTIPENGLTVLYAFRKNTGVVTSDIVYKVGSRDEARGETGIAHMLEHMLFKPTKADIKRKTDSGAMHFEREAGIAINANTWKDRTSYYFSYPKEHFERALRTEAERMHGVVLTEAEFKPERTNVLSEFDMYAGDEQFALSVQMMGVAMQSHPYGHETIGYREDIEAYTIEKLKSFYQKYYAPNNATLIIVGDIEEDVMQEMVVKHFGKLKKSTTLTERTYSIEPKQEGVRTVTVERKTSTNVYALGVRAEAFPTQAWFEMMVLFDLLAGGSDSILHKKLVDTGLATSMNVSLEPTRDKNIAILFVTLSQKATHEKIHAIIQKTIVDLTLESIKPYLKKTIAKSLTDEFVGRENSLSYVSELVEYVSAGAWESFFDTEKILKSITAKAILERAHTVCTESQTTIGYFIGTK